ncbi:hypothetical protein BDV98DRAFT_563791 [Pterulicium gracile]|uniref:F-box domain-containing protein n=1 Tax=Pterulicium gracile TaxID=1884261 RepID=A0A5C3QUR8_9AGAR|nr:hypothetical protein BDV98DRAFT_563791 [Pterula gracilis]
MILMLATFNLIQVPQLETLLLSELQGGFHMALMFVGTEHLVGLGSIRELVIQDTKTNPTPSDTLTNMLHHLTGLEVLSMDGFSYEQDDEWLEALSWTNPSDGSAVYMPTQYMTRPDLKRLICPNLRRLDLQRMKVDSRRLRAAVQSRTRGSGGSLWEVRFEELTFTDEDKGGAGLEWVPQDLLD